MSTNQETMAACNPDQRDIELRSARNESINEQPGDLSEPSDDYLVNLATIEPVPPNGGYGWVCTFAVLLVNAHTWGINASWAVIMAHYSLHSDQLKASHFTYAIIGGLSVSQSLVVSPAVSWFRNRFGTRSTLLFGTLLFFTSLFTSSFVNQVWQLVLSQGICFGWGMGFIWITATSILPSWFSSRRSLAVGLATSGAGIGGLVYSLVTNAAIQNLGVEWAYRILAFCSLVANLSASLLLKETGGRAASVNPREELRFDYHDFGHVQILLIMFWGVVTELGYIALLYSLPSFASSVGLTPFQGSIANAMLNLGLALGRPITGYLSDTFGRINVATLLTAACAVFCFSMWIPAQSFSLLAVFAVFAGTTCGTFWGTVTPVLAEVVGIRKLTGTFGIVCLALVLPTTFAEVVAIELSRPGHADGADFMGTQIFVAVMFLAGGVSMWMLRCWKMSEMEREQLSGTNASSDSGSSKIWISWLTPKFLFRLRYV
ncbi:putative transporter MCH2 [Paramyrothecium foliicola]|nr:putative transporter MCH2 [Paramyrothecium foliicola]